MQENSILKALGEREVIFDNCVLIYFIINMQLNYFLKDGLLPVHTCKLA